MVEFENGSKLAEFPLATSRRYKDKEGNLLEQTAWHRIKFRGPKADQVANIVKKGALVQVDGSIRYDSYTDKEGKEVHVTAITGESFSILMFPKRKDEGEGEGEKRQDDDEE
ncbi:hypothetical protein H4R19_001468 [Coemansia spiralis]|nr:hypothetical protein H4R19_001468 [Coemansia spiralis]